MIVVIDMGNSAITFGKSENGKISSAWSMPTLDIENTRRFKKNLFAELRKNKVDSRKTEAVVLCSVVPKKNKSLIGMMKNIFTGSHFSTIGAEIKIPLKNKCRYPSQTGNDRLVNALAAVYFYRAPAIIVDFGTAITIDVVSSKKEFLGGAIIPGLRLSLKSLDQNTALLPSLELKAPKQILGNDTKSAILSGIFYGTGFLVDGFIVGFKRRLKKDFIVIGTGGNIELIKPYCRNIMFFDRFLTLKGIVIAQKIAKNKEK